jgi:CheY-specific phosphatase CheX
MMKAISEVLETMFFLSIDFEDRSLEEHVGLNEARISVWLDGLELSLGLKMADDFARMAAANFLGVEEEEVDESEVMDVLGEMANMVGGSFIEKAGNGDARLGIPTYSRSMGALQENGEGLPFTFMGDFAGLAYWDLIAPNND